MLGGQRIVQSRQEQSVFLTGAALTFVPGQVGLSFGPPPIRKTGSYTPAISAQASHTPVIYKMKVGDV